MNAEFHTTEFQRVGPAFIMTRSPKDFPRVVGP